MVTHFNKYFNITNFNATNLILRLRNIIIKNK